MNLNYRFQPKDGSRREVTDPVLGYFKGYYCLFAFRSGGYWRSEDLVGWECIPYTTILTLENYASTIFPIGDTLYSTTSSGKTQTFKNTRPEKDTWEAVDTKLTYRLHDPALYSDEDGKVYMYWRCSDRDSIMGVKVDPKNGFRALGEVKILIMYHGDECDWEVSGKNNEEPRQGWNEGPCMLRYEGRYYLRYTVPGTQYRIYDDGIYVGDTLLGPLGYVEDNPFSFKPGGSIGRTEHGHIFQDKYGNYQHVVSMIIPVYHMLEWRSGLFPAAISSRNGIYTHTVWPDYPFYIPNRKVNFDKTDLSMGWSLLSYRKSVQTSSPPAGYGPGNANDEQIETWQATQTGKKSEWLQVDLGTLMLVNSTHVNFADHHSKAFAPRPPIVYQFFTEGPVDGKKWMNLFDERENGKDGPHRLSTLGKPMKARYLRICNTKETDGCFSLSGFRISDKGEGAAPSKVTSSRTIRDSENKRMSRFTRDVQREATGYVLRWGTQKDRLTYAMMVFDNQYEARYFNRDSEYYFSITAFNENGSW